MRRAMSCPSLRPALLLAATPALSLPFEPCTPVLPRYLAAVNHAVVGSDDVSVTLCGQPEAVDAWLCRDEGSVELRPGHPWHHPAYCTTEAYAQWGVSSGIDRFEKKPGHGCTFISATTASVLHAVDKSHWQAWLSQPVSFKASLELLASMAAQEPDAPLYVIQCAPHPVLDAAVDSLASLLQAAASAPLLARCASMRRGVAAAAFLREQRGHLAKVSLLQSCLMAALEPALTLTIGSRTISVDPEVPFNEQGITSAQATRSCYARGRVPLLMLTRHP